MYLAAFEAKYKTVLTDEMRYDVRILAATYIRHAVRHTINPEATASNIIELAKAGVDNLCNHSEDN